MSRHLRGQLRAWAVGLAGVAALGASLAACFSPLQPPCAFSCSVDQACPASYTCGGDGLCHHAGSAGFCALDPADGATSAPDGADAGDAGAP
jgi:hypothetical protein